MVGRISHAPLGNQRYTSDMVLDDLRGDLESLFVAAAKAATTRLREHGLPLTTLAVRQVVERDEENLSTWRAFGQQVQQNVLSDQGFGLYRIAPLLAADVVLAARQVASQMASATDSKFPFFAPLGIGHANWLFNDSDTMPPSPEYASDPGEWVARYVVFPALLTHLQMLPSLEKAGRARVAFADEVVLFARSSGMTYRTSAPLAGITLPKSRSSGLLAAGGRLYRLTPEEQGEVIERWGLTSHHLGIFASLPLVALEVLVGTDREAQNLNPQEPLTRWLCAFQLHGFPIAGRTGSFEPFPQWSLPMSSPAVPLQLPNTTNDWLAVRPAAFGKIGATANRLKEFKLAEPRKVQDFALHRFWQGGSRQTAADAVVDFVVALESLLLPYDNETRHGDLSYRFRLHGALYLAKNKADRLAVHKTLNDLYGLRSTLVHGNKYPTQEKIVKGRKSAEELARRGLLRALDEGFPTVETFKKLTYGAN